jgi:tetratricopeptide (TPR) repeat protein
MEKNHFHVRNIIFLVLAVPVIFSGLNGCGKDSYQFDNTIECCIKDTDVNETGINKSYEWNDLGNCLYNLERYPEAIKAYENAIAEDPNYLDAWNNRGDALYYNGEKDRNYSSYVEAERSYKYNRTLQGDPWQEAMSGKGKSLIRQKKIAEADVLFKEFRKYSDRPESEYVFVILIYLILLILFYFYYNTPMLASGIKGMRIQLRFG